jgi:hypothetical protein
MNARPYTIFGAALLVSLLSACSAGSNDSVSVSPGRRSLGADDDSRDLVVKIELARQPNNRIEASTNLPDGTQLQASLQPPLATCRPNCGYVWEASLTVAHGHFIIGPFRSDLTAGTYTLEITSPPAALQPESVRALIGDTGEHLKGQFTKAELAPGVGPTVYINASIEMVASNAQPSDPPGSTFECRAIAVTGFGDGDDIFTEDSKRAILTVPNFSITSATANNARVALYGGIAPRDITMREAFSSAEAMLNALRREGHVLPQPLSPNPDYASNPDAPCNGDAVKTAMTNQMDDWITSAFPRYAGTPAPGKARSVIVYAWRVLSPPTAVDLEQQHKVKEAASQAAQQQAAISSASSGSDLCRAVALVRVPSIENPESALAPGEVQDSVTQYRVSKKTGVGSFCSHGGYCYPRFITIGGKLTEALQLQNCRIGGKTFEYEDDTGYSVDLDRSKNSQADLKYNDLTNTLLTMGLCNACAGNAAQYYLQKPSSECGLLVKSALEGDSTSKARLVEFPDYCHWAY